MTSKRVCLITAASRGIGRSCALAMRKAGYDLSIMSRSQDIFSVRDEVGGVALQGSVTDLSDLRQLVDTTLHSYGRIDCVVVNTGDVRHKDLPEISDNDWTAAMAIYLMPVIRLASILTPHLVTQGGGTWVNISAEDALEPDLRFAQGSVFRAALCAYTKLYAKRYAGSRIRMNSVLPGITFDHEPGAIRPDIISEVPLGRPAYYEEIAHVVRFLCGEESSYITGSNLRVDGGMSQSL